ncbi:anionic trypsin-like [Sebastes fasciatus]|uniref:anionic trypsin-like n=1 Tax=Sebastes fasciatus TaxID=394691 RepID=UPI003D9F7278
MGQCVQLVLLPPSGGQSLNEIGGMTRLLLLLWAGVTASTVVDLQKRIIGGRNCTQTERLYHVEVRAYTAFPGAVFTICGSSLIGDRWILTAEHCWNPASHCVARSAIAALSLPRMLVEPKPGRATVLQCANTTVVNCQRLINCLQTNYQGFYATRQYQHWKCYQSPGVSTSPGDSGGGVVFNGRIYGVHVFSGNATHACVEAAGFMDVCRYMDWIVTTTGIPRP